MADNETFEGNAYVISVAISPGETVRPPSQDCKLVKLSRWNTTEDEQFTNMFGPEVENSDGEVYYGFNGALFGQLFPARETDLMPLSNLDQILLRATNKVSGVVIVRIAFFN